MQLHPPPGLLTHFEYNAVLGPHVVLMDQHMDIDSLECETTSSIPDGDPPPTPPHTNKERETARKSPRKNPRQPVTEPNKPAPPLEKAHSKHEFSLDIEVTLREPPKSFFSLGQSKSMLVKGGLITGAAQWGDCKHNATHRR
eukprot:9479803-Pyramimonas_sp.AAC.1